MVFSHPIAARPSANAAQMAPSSSQSLAELGWLSPPCHPPPGGRRAAVFLLEEAAQNQGFVSLSKNRATPKSGVFLILPIPYALCMVYLPTFALKITQM